jgi:hypothetical protein
MSFMQNSAKITGLHHTDAEEEIPEKGRSCFTVRNIRP